MNRPATPVAGLFAFLLLLAGCQGQVAPERASEASSSLEVGRYDEALTEATNSLRREQDLPLLEESGCLSRAARQRAGDLVGRDLVHADLRRVSDRCGDGARTAENLVRSAIEPTAVVAEWMKSPGHRNNLVDPQLSKLGTGCVRDDDRLLCSQLYLAAP